jgi:hypothetical protein
LGIAGVPLPYPTTFGRVDPGEPSFEEAVAVALEIVRAHVRLALAQGVDFVSGGTASD